MNDLFINDLGLKLAEIFLTSTTIINFVVINGEKIHDKQSLFEEFSKKLEFPDYFGFNWDAFADCMTDLSWVDSDKSLFIIYNNSQKFREKNTEEWRIFQDILLETIDYWRDRKRLVTIIFS